MLAAARARRLRKSRATRPPNRAERGNNRRIGRADGRNDHRLIPAARQLPEDVRRLGRGKGDDSVGRKNRAGDGRAGFVGRPARRQIDGKNRRAGCSGSHSSAASARPLSGGLNPVPTHSVDNQVGFERILVPQPARLRARDHVHQAPHRVGQLAPGHGRIALQSFRRAEQQRGHLEARLRTSSRAAIMPSPPLLPRPHSTVTRCARGNCSRAKAATAAAAARIRSDRRNAETLGGGAVAGLHLGCGENVHRIHGTRSGGQCESEWGVRKSIRQHARRTLTLHTHTALRYFSSRACNEACEPERVRTQEPFLSQRK